MAVFRELPFAHDAVHGFELVAFCLWSAGLLWVRRHPRPVYIGAYLGSSTLALFDWTFNSKWFFNVTYDVPAAVRGDAQIAFAVTVLTAAVGFVGMLPNGVLSAYDDFVPRNVVRLGGVVLRLGLTLGLLTLWPSLTVLALIQFVCLAFDFSLCSWLMLRRYPGIRIRLADFDWGMVRRILSFSVYVLVLSAGIRLSFETDALVIGKFQDVSSIPYFTVANSFLLYLMEFIIAIAAVVMPMATRLKTQGRELELRETFLKWSKIALSLTMMAGLFLIILGPRFIAWWIDPAFEAPAGQVLQIRNASCAFSTI